MKQHSEITYRADIDGLRALAVLAVVVFHAFPSYLPGGFIGVDIFFVISGYLISNIIFKSFEQNSFSLTEFYSRRVLRIFPALSVVLASVLAFGWYLLFAAEFSQLGKHVAAGAGFISNLVFWRESGYFDASAEMKPLLHLWSLGIEEQFYLIWPLLIWVLFKIKNGLLTGLMTIFLISFSASVYLAFSDASAAYYSPLSRFWELAAGGVLAFFAWNNSAGVLKANARWSSALSLIGISLIGVGLFLIDKKSIFPGFWAAVPVFGALCLIAAGPATLINKQLFSNKVAVWFGLISYPLYLWHWPLLALPKVIGITMTRELRFGLVLLAVVLAWLTYRYFETPIRHSRNRGRNVFLLCTAVAIIGLFGYAVHSTNGMRGYGIRASGASEFVEQFENSMPQLKYIESNDLLKKFRDECNFNDLEKNRVSLSTHVPRRGIAVSCYRRNPKFPKSVLIWGDSHAQQLNYGLVNNLPKEWQVLQVASSGCSADIEPAADPVIDYCAKSNVVALATVSKAKPDVVIIAQANTNSSSNIVHIDKYLRSLGVKKVVFVGQTPHWKFTLPQNIARNHWPNPPERTNVGLDADVIQANAALNNAMSQYADIEFVDAIGVFCNASGCLTRIGSDQVKGITSWDYSHLTPIASDYLARKKLVKAIISEDSGNER